MGNKRLMESLWNRRLRARNRQARYTICVICEGEVLRSATDLVGRCPTCVQEARIVKHKVTIVGTGNKQGLGEYLVELGKKLIENEAGNGNEELVSLSEDWGKVSGVIKRIEGKGGASC